MKKFLTIFLALCFVISCTACSGDSQGAQQNSQQLEQQPQSKEIELTVANIDDYLAFEFDYSKVRRETKIGISFGYTDITLKSYAVSSGSFNNVKITMEIPLTNGWSVSSSDEAYNENNSEVLTCSFRLPSSGEYTDTHDLIASIVYSDPDSQNVRYTITEVSGTFKPN